MAKNSKQPSRTLYRPSKKVEKAREEVYKDIDEMIRVKSAAYPQFASEDGDRTLLQYIQDSDRRVNAYTLPREVQGKEDWQSNLFNPVTSNKLKAVVAGVSLNVPQLSFTAVNQGGIFSARRAELIRQLVRHSRVAYGNPEIDIFFEAWECTAKGTVIKYDGYLKTKMKRKFVKSMDLETGEIDFDEREVVVDDRPIDLQVPIEEFFWKDMYTFDVQDQDAVAWIQHYSYDQLEREFGQYKNFKFVKDAKSIKRYKNETTSYFYTKWEGRVDEEDDYEVIRYYNKPEDRYEIWVNGVEMLRAPLIWGRKKKYYPFSKTIFEPFDKKNFFVGKSIAGMLEGLQDMNNTILNTMLDKLFRSLTKPMLVGLANKDLLDIEDELVNQDNKIYVPDVSQVKPMPFEGVSNGDLAMLQAIATMTDHTSLDSNQQGLQGRGVTAREVVIADENARKLKGIFFKFLTDLWIQKTRIRIENVLLHYMQPKVEAIVGPEGQQIIQEALTIYNIPETQLSDGSTGVLGVQVASNEEQMLDLVEIEAREEAMQEEGINYKMIAVTSSYLDDWVFDFNVISQSLYDQDRVRKEAETMDKMNHMAVFFPERFAVNKEKMFADFVDIYNESPEEYEEAPQAPPSIPGEGEPLLNFEQENA